MSFPFTRARPISYLSESKPKKKLNFISLNVIFFFSYTKFLMYKYKFIKINKSIKFYLYHAVIFCVCGFSCLVIFFFFIFLLNVLLM